MLEKERGERERERERERARERERERERGGGSREKKRERGERVYRRPSKNLSRHAIPQYCTVGIERLKRLSCIALLLFFFF